jgi:hypothetical protein
MVRSQKVYEPHRHHRNISSVVAFGLITILAVLSLGMLRALRVYLDSPRTAGTIAVLQQTLVVVALVAVVLAYCFVRRVQTGRRAYAAQQRTAGQQQYTAKTFAARQNVGPTQQPLVMPPGVSQVPPLPEWQAPIESGSALLRQSEYPTGPINPGPFTP